MTELLTKTKMHTGKEMKVQWQWLDKKSIPKDLQKWAKFILKQNDVEVGVIEFVRTSE